VKPAVRRWLTWPKLLLAAVALLFLAAWYVPQISAERYREPIRAGLENALGRKVEISEVSFRLLPVPGFTVTNVIVGEDPAVGLEPMAIVSVLRGRPRLSALFGGPLEFASVDLEDTSVNLTRVDKANEATRWNFTSLMRPKLLKAFPDVHLIGGRVNFKFGDTKSVFYLLNTDVDLWPPNAADGPWTLKVHSYPARTDRPSRGFGSFVGRGEWHPASGLVTIDARLEKSELGDLITLFQGKESYVQGHVWGDAHLSGPVSRIGVSGRLRVDDIHGWNQTPPGGSAWPLVLSGAIDVPGQSVELHAVAEGQTPPLDLRYQVSGYLARPRWSVTAQLNQLPVAPFVAIARNLGFDLPADLKFDGAAQGTVAYSEPDGASQMDGDVRIGDAVLTAADAPPVHLSNIDLRFAGSTVTMAPVTLTNETKEAAAVEGSFDAAGRKLQLSLASEGMPVLSLRRQLAVAHVPLLGLATSGSWSGRLTYSSVDEAGWEGEIHLKDADLSFEAFSQPLHLAAVDATLDSDGLVTKHLMFAIGGIEGQGEYRYETGAERPHRFKLTLGKVEAAELEKLLMPALHRGNFLNYAFKFGRVPQPDWMRSMHADGTLQIGSLDLGGMSFTKVKTRARWDGDSIHLLGLQGNLKDAVFQGTASANLAQREPRYDMAGKVSGLFWKSGVLDADGTLATQGTSGDVLSNLKAEGKMKGRGFDLAPLPVGERVEGTFEFSFMGKTPRLKLGDLVMPAGGLVFRGGAETRNDGKLILRATDGTKQIDAEIP
jgi:hypothetical protein